MHAVTPRMAPSANSSLALPPSAETIALWLAPVALRSSVIVPLPSMLWKFAASRRNG